MVCHHYSFYEFCSKLFESFSIDSNNYSRLIVAFLPSIIALAYPLIIQTVNGLDTKYNSSRIVGLFKIERTHKVFVIFLVASLVSTGFTIFNNSIFPTISFLFLILLIIYFLKFIKLVLTYSDVEALFDHFLAKLDIDKLNKKNSINEAKIIREKCLDLYDTITDLYIFCIASKNYELQTDIRDKFFSEISFSFKDKKSENKYIEYNSVIFNNNFKIIEAYFYQMSNYQRYEPIEYFSIDFYLDYSIDSKGPIPISAGTFSFIWRSIVFLAKTGNYGKIERIWEFIHNYRNSYLSRSYIEYDEEFKMIPDTIKKDEVLKMYKRDLNELCVSILGLLYYKKKYELIDRLLFYTQNQPPRIFINEFRLDEIVDLFFEFQKDIFEKDWVVQYYFDDISFDSIGFEKDSRFYISEFCVVFFLYYWINDYRSGLRHEISELTLPRGLRDADFLIKKLDYLLLKINKILSNNELLSLTSLKRITRRGCFLGDLKFPTVLINDFKNKNQALALEILREEELDQNKVRELIDNSILAIDECLSKISRVKGKDIEKSNRDLISEHMQVIRGSNIPLDREAFLPESRVHYLDFDSVLARYIRNNYYSHFLDKLNLLSEKKYKVEFKLLFKAIDKLNLDPSEFTIIASNLRLEYLNKFLNLELEASENNSSDFNYKGIPIFVIDGGSVRSGCLYIFRNSDRPMVKHKKWEDIENPSKEFSDYWGSMSIVDNENFIYFKQTELKDSPELLSKYILNSGKSKEELEMQVEFIIDFIGYCWFPKNVKIVCISQGQIFQQGGELDKLDDISPF